ATGIEGGVGSAEDDDAAMLRPFGEVAVAPDVGETLEIRRTIACAVGIVPEPDGHRRERSRADEFALPGRQRPAVLVEYIHRHAEMRPLDLAAPDRLGRHAAD